MRIAFSGCEVIDFVPDGLYVRSVVRDLTHPAALITGGARGVDTVAALAARDFHPGVEQRIIYPDGRWNEDLREQVPGATFYPGGSYMERNDALVEHADLLIAFPRTEHEVLRSGTWATVRRARKRGVEVRLHPLDSIRPRT